MIYGYGALIVRYLRRLLHLREMLPGEEERPPTPITHRWDFYGAFYFLSISFSLSRCCPVLASRRDSCRWPVSTIRRAYVKTRM